MGVNVKGDSGLPLKRREAAENRTLTGVNRRHFGIYGQFSVVNHKRGTPSKLTCRTLWIFESLLRLGPGEREEASEAGVEGPLRAKVEGGGGDCPRRRWVGWDKTGRVSARRGGGKYFFRGPKFTPRKQKPLDDRCVPFLKDRSVFKWR